MDKIKKLIKKFCTREIIFYVIFGVFTTIVNVGSFYVMNKIWSWNEDLSNFIAIVLAVLFAYITNKMFVFDSKTKGIKNLIRECISFFLARILSGILCDIGSFALMVKVFNINDIISKIITQVMVVIVNYIFSKFLVFKKKSKNSSK